jgi:hypothetical protein
MFVAIVTTMAAIPLKNPERAGSEGDRIRLDDSRRRPILHPNRTIVRLQDAFHTPSYQLSSAGPFDQWPSGMGFDHFYGFMGGETDQWTPFLFRDKTQVFPWIGRPGYNLTTDMADEAISYLKGLNNAAPDKPFFLYYVPGGSHALHQPTPEWIKKISDMHLFDQGWEKLRETIFANQKRLGVVPANAQLTPRPDGQPEYGGAKLQKWETEIGGRTRPSAALAAGTAASDSLARNESQQVSVDGLGLCSRHAVRKALIGFQGAVRQ